MRAVLAFALAASAAAQQGPSAPFALAAVPAQGAVCVADGAAVRIVDVATRQVRRSISLPGSPTGIAARADSSVVYVTCADALWAFDFELERPWCVARGGHWFTAPTPAPGGRTLWVCDRFRCDVVGIDVVAGEETVRIPVAREPVATALSTDGGLLLVAHLLPTEKVVGGYQAAGVSFVDTARRSVTGFVPFPDGSTALRDICLSPDGRHAYVSHVLGRYHLPTTQLDRGWVNTNALSVLSVEDLALVATVLVDDLDLGAADPWGIGCSADGRWLCVAHAGTDELSVIDRPALHAKLALAHAGDVADDLTFLVDVRRRVPLGGRGPRGLAVVDDEVWTAEYFSGSVGAVVLVAGGDLSAESVLVGAGGAPPLERRGEFLFHDADASFQHWLSCATCHPGGRADALTWDLLNDGLGNPKNTRSMLLSHATPPAMSTGVRPGADAAVRAGVRHIQFAVLGDEDVAAIDAYLASLAPVPSPRLVDGRLSEVGERGRAVFERVGCAVCHPAPLYTDLGMYDVGTGSGGEEGRAFDTPTLVEVWRTAPYLADGSAATLRESILRHRYEGDEALRELGEVDIRALVEFVGSL